MTTYILLMNWTDQGVRQVRDSPRRLDAAKQALKDEGGEFKHIFLTMGMYDLIAVYRGAGRRRRGALHHADRHARQCPHADAQGVSRERLSRNRRLAGLNPGSNPSNPRIERSGRRRRGVAVNFNRAKFKPLIKLRPMCTDYRGRRLALAAPLAP